MGDPFGEIRGNDPELWDEIERDRIEGDSDENAVLRWLGGLLDELEDQLNALLPMNWYAKIEDGKVGK